MRQLTAEPSAFFDTVRGGGALVVAAIHSLAIFVREPTGMWIAFGHAFLLAFFLLSGFLIHRATARRSIRSFVQSRMLRIVPPFLVAIGLTVALWAIAPALFPSGTRAFLSATAREGMDLAYLPSTLLLVNGLIGGTLSANGPLWSLAFEVWLYALATMFIAGGRWRILALAAIPLICLRNPAFTIYGATFLVGWCWSTLHVQGRADVPRVAFRPFACAAPFSYTLYIFHFPMLLFLYGATGERPWMMLPSLVAVIAVCAVVGPAVEEMGHRLSRRRAGDEQRVAVPRPAGG